MDIAELMRRLDGLWIAHRSERFVEMRKKVTEIVAGHAARGMLVSGGMLVSIKQVFEEEIPKGAICAFELLQSTHRAMGPGVIHDIRIACHGWLSQTILEYAHYCASTSESHIRQYSGGLQNQSMLAETDLSNVGGPQVSKYRILLDNYLDEAGSLDEVVMATTSISNASRVDVLTELLDRASFDPQLSQEILGADERHESLALVFVDVDHFKKVNDTHGHQKGDDVLKAVGQILNSVARGKGSAFRYGGEEMVILLPNHDLNEAVSVAERCRLKIEAAQPGGIQVTASLGVGIYPDFSKTGKELLQVADKAMYDAKNRGRNLVRFHGEPEPKAKGTKREPERKQPEGSRFTTAQMEKMRKDHFQGHAAICPEDQTPLRVSESNELGRATPRLIVTCPFCGLNEVIG